ncbi:MAG: hypothetical protein Q8J68_14650 [Methanolobus sp.]|uniref:hypothetical protein n=1 Tax=Methanolobus sp. TaxID=1874737 RepID=UPI0027306DCF|nr:hypothetical protein [Methanolobus sp.]MDP2218514.1 hypothetical protein [Methanolobus sp.]
MVRETYNEKTLEKIGKRLAIIVLFIAWLMICWLLFKVFTTDPEDRPPRVLSEYQKVKIEKHCQDRKIRLEVIEIETDGRMTYLLNGQRCEIK